LHCPPRLIELERKRTSPFRGERFQHNYSHSGIIFFIWISSVASNNLGQIIMRNYGEKWLHESPRLAPEISRGPAKELFERYGKTNRHH
jgi:hypothetical protein